MPALDTNVLVRYIVRDDAAQLAAAQRLIRRCVAAQQTLFVPVTVTLELEWVLRSSFGFTKDEVVQALSDLFSAAELSFESDRALEVALELYRGRTADFADCVHIALSAQAGEQPLWTFDKSASKVPGAQLLTNVPAGKPP
ncbi:MAG: type II toxin-antitoxin system VapC family toxin [Rubrivivax sp.]